MKLPQLNAKLLTGLSYGPRIRPYRDWFVLLAVGTVLLLGSAAWNAWLFYRVFNGEILGTPADSSGSDFNAASLSKAEEIFSKRAAEEARYRNEYQFVDPSL